MRKYKMKKSITYAQAEKEGLNFWLLVKARNGYITAEAVAESFNNDIKADMVEIEHDEETGGSRPYLKEGAIYKMADLVCSEEVTAAFELAIRAAVMKVQDE